MAVQRKGLLLVVSGPAGVGKGTVNAALMAKHPEIRMSVSATTRKPRPGEIDGVHYFFKTEEDFRRMIDEDAFLEYMHVFGLNYYGTPRSFVESEREKGNHVILEIDVQGAAKVKEKCPDAVLIFIAPPSLKILKDRLVGRGTETQESIDIRTKTALDELNKLPSYDYMVINDVVEEAVSEMEAIITAELCRTGRNTTLMTKFTGGETI